MKKALQLLFVFSFILPGVAVHAQQDAQFSQFFFNKFIYNPAVAGTENSLGLTAFYRNQWSGLEGNPVTQSISAEFPIYNISSGAGLYFINDMLGQERNMKIMAAYSYKIDVSGGILSLGVNGGIIQKSLDGTKLTTPDGEYGEGVPPNHNDNYLPHSKVADVTPDLGLGIYFKKDRVNFGIAAKHLLEPDITLEYPNGSTEFSYRRHFYAHGGYFISLGPTFDLQPSVMIKSDLTEHQLDVNTLLYYKDYIWTGISYRGYNKNSSDAVMGMVGLKLTPNLMFGYSYDFNVSALQQVNSGSHEVFVNYRIPMAMPGKGKIINNPRFLYY